MTIGPSSSLNDLRVCCYWAFRRIRVCSVRDLFRDLFAVFRREAAQLSLGINAFGMANERGAEFAHLPQKSVHVSRLFDTVIQGCET